MAARLPRSATLRLETVWSSPSDGDDFCAGPAVLRLASPFPVVRVIYRFETFTLDAARRELRRSHELVALEPQVFDLLEFLIGARDRVVSRDDLLEAVWHGRIVSEATISSRLNAARTAIGDTGAEQRLIRTLPRKGVRFVGEVREVRRARGAGRLRAARGRAVACARPRLPAVAVLPFTNMSGDPEQDYFADGIAEEIITALSRSSGLFVIARNSSFTYKGKAIDMRQVGQELGVGYVLEGSVRRSGERLRITGQLVDAASGAHLWSDRFEGDPGDVFALQDRVSESVAAAIEPTLQSAEIGRLRQHRPARLDAYDLPAARLRSALRFHAASMEAALLCLDQSLALDPAYAPAMAAAAYCRAQCHFQGWARQGDADRAQAVRLAWRAAELAPNDAQVLWMAAFAIWNMAESGRERARDLFSRSLLINPNSAMALTLAGWIETMCGNQDAGREMVARAQSLNPRDPRGWLALGVLAIAAVIEGDYARGGALGRTCARPEQALRRRAPGAGRGAGEARPARWRAARRPGTARDRAGTHRVGISPPDPSASGEHGEDLCGCARGGRIAAVTETSGASVLPRFQRVTEDASAPQPLRRGPSQEHRLMNSTLSRDQAQPLPVSAGKACRVHRFGGPEVISLETIEAPQPGPGEVLVRVKAAGVGPWDAWIRSGRSACRSPCRSRWAPTLRASSWRPAPA